MFFEVNCVQLLLFFFCVYFISDFYMTLTVSSFCCIVDCLQRFNVLLHCLRLTSAATYSKHVLYICILVFYFVFYILSFLVSSVLFLSVV